MVSVLFQNLSEKLDGMAMSELHKYNEIYKQCGSEYAGVDRHLELGGEIDEAIQRVAFVCHGRGSLEEFDGPNYLRWGDVAKRVISLCTRETPKMGGLEQTRTFSDTKTMRAVFYDMRNRIEFSDGINHNLDGYRFAAVVADGTARLRPISD